MGMALIKNGYSCNSGDPSQVGKATKSLLDLKPHVASFTTNLAPVIASGDAWLMEGWTTQIYQGLVQNKNPSNVGFSVPPNGPLLAGAGGRGRLHRRQSHHGDVLTLHRGRTRREDHADDPRGLRPGVTVARRAGARG